MKRILFGLILISLFSCKKENSRCYKCEEIINQGMPACDGNITPLPGYPFSDTSKYDLCGKSEAEIKAIEADSVLSIGDCIGGKDHATVLHASKTINNLIDTNREFRGFIRNLNESFKNNEELKLGIEDLAISCAQL